MHSHSAHSIFIHHLSLFVQIHSVIFVGFQMRDQEACAPNSTNASVKHTVIDRSIRGNCERIKVCFCSCRWWWWCVLVTLGTLITHAPFFTASYIGCLWCWHCGWPCTKHQNSLSLPLCWKWSDWASCLSQDKIIAVHHAKQRFSEVKLFTCQSKSGMLLWFIGKMGRQGWQASIIHSFIRRVSYWQHDWSINQLRAKTHIQSHGVRWNKLCH